VWSLYRRYACRRRFWTRVQVTTPGGCWPWCGDADIDGRPRFDGRFACEQAYELVRGPLPPGTAVEHRCGNPTCMNPEHLEVHDLR
jgi:hypothetical protein